MKSLTLVVSIIIFKVCIAAWIQSPLPLPTTDTEMACGAWNGKILILGGSIAGNPRQLTEIDTDTKSVTDLGTNGLSANVPGGEGQYWTQIDHIVYMIDDAVAQLNIYNMSDRIYTTNWLTIPSGREPGSDGCLASDTEYLYITGGDYGGVNGRLQILFISSRTWLSNPPSMNENREKHGCVVHNGYLWVFAGHDNGKETDTNERIAITGILSNNWDITIDPLTDAIDGVRASAHIDTIYVTGGDSNKNGRFDGIHLVDANTGTITVSSDHMHQGPWLHATVIYDSVLYVLGGFETNGDDWTYYQLPTAGTDSPTQIPTTSPHIPTPEATTTTTTTTTTSAPTTQPTPSPTLNPTPPTSNPTTDPTLSPSNNPTLLPTNYPSVSPSLNPSSPPVSGPTSSPSLRPSISPSTNPTISPPTDPTELPSSDSPSIHPTDAPTKTTADPTFPLTSYPSLYPSSNPSLYPTLTLTFIETAASQTRYTISITINECSSDESKCNIDESTINNILIAFLDEDVHILGTDINDNEINIIVGIDGYYVLDRDVISNGLEKEFEAEYGDVDVHIEDTDDEIHIPPRTKKMSHLMIIVGVIILTAVIGAAITCIYLLCIHYTAKKQAQLEHDMMEFTNETKDAATATATTKSAGIASCITSDIVLDNELESGSPKGNHDTDDTDDESLYDRGISTAGAEPEAGEKEGCERDGPQRKEEMRESEKLYFNENKVITPMGFTKGGTITKGGATNGSTVPGPTTTGHRQTI